MDVQNKLDEIVAAVSGARSMPMSASCVVNRADLLAMLDEVRQALPGSLAQAEELIGGREQLVEQAHQEAGRIIENAHAERGSLLSETEIVRRAQAEADRVLGEARQEAEEVRAEADEYVDSKLANFEVVLTKTLGSVGRGREKLLGTGPGLDESGYEDEDAPERSHDPDTLRRTADEYVDVKLGAFEAVLAKTLEAVHRGRQKLHGRIATDDLGGLDALAEDGAGPDHTTSDSDYLAELANLAADEQGGRGRRQDRSGRPEPAAASAEAPVPPQQPVVDVPGQQQYEQDPAFAYQQADPYGYQQQYAQQQDAYGYPQADQYAAADYSQQGYDPQQYAQDYSQQGYGQQAQQQQDQQYGYDPQALDETSLFDTGMISAEQLRAYEQGRGNH